EKISFRRFARLETPAGTPGMVVPYIHAGGKIGVLVAVSGAGRSNAAAAALAKDLAMQVAAANPSYIGRADVPAPVIEHEKTIYREQAKASGKPDKILDKIADGKLEKYFGDFCLVEQAFIKDPDRKVSQLLADAGKAAGAPIAVCAFARFQVGEGMEKRSDDLAAEVAKQLGQG
ncbi:MAG: translation elongation factor Ts, partial [Candidatus Deferrimicrobium sp.]